MNTGKLLLFLVLTSLAPLISGARAETRCWNGSRGFESFSRQWTDSGDISEGIIENATADTLHFCTAMSPCESLEFRFKAMNHRCAPAKRYSYTDGNSTRHTTLPPWGIILRATDDSDVEFRFSVSETASDGISSSPALMLEVLENGCIIDSKLFSNSATPVSGKLRTNIEGLDYSGVQNAFKLSFENGNVILTGGIHSPTHIYSKSVSDTLRPSEVGFTLYPAARLQLDEMRLTTSSARLEAMDSPWSDAEALGDYLDMSDDHLEGCWQVLDRSLEENLLKFGGDYRFAMVRALDGYDLIYLSGATVNRSKWESGMIKAHLTPSGIEGIWNVRWTDAMFQPLGNEIKAELEQAGTLSFSFPYHSSTFRLQKTSYSTRP